MYNESADFRENTQKVLVGSGFSGLVDEVRIFGGARSEVDVRMGMMCPTDKTGSAPPLALYLMLNDNVGSSAWDYSTHAGKAMFCENKPAPEWSMENSPYDKVDKN
eukprot:3413417-Pyramimonas_sp.AAC.1